MKMSQFLFKNCSVLVNGARISGVTIELENIPPIPRSWVKIKEVKEHSTIFICEANGGTFEVDALGGRLLHAALLVHVHSLSVQSPFTVTVQGA